MDWTGFTRTFFLTGVVAVAAVAIGSKFVPEPFRSHNPSQSTALRAEAARRDGSACLMILGDSRAAFGINSNELDRPDCDAENYGYPGLGLEASVALAERIAKEGGRPKTILLSISETMLFGAPEDHPWSLPPFVLRLRIAIARTSLFLRHIGRRPPMVDWRWNETLGRWESLNLERSFPKVANHSRELADMIRDYGARRMTGVDMRLNAAVARLQAISPNVMIVQMPSYAPFPRPDLVTPAARAGAKAFSLDANSEHFADPVHLNPDGARAATRAIKKNMFQ